MGVRASLSGFRRQRKMVRRGSHRRRHGDLRFKLVQGKLRDHDQPRVPPRPTQISFCTIAREKKQQAMNNLILATVLVAAAAALCLRTQTQINAASAKNAQLADSLSTAKSAAAKNQSE